MSLLTAGPGVPPAAQQPLAEVEGPAAASQVAPQATRHFIVGATERPLLSSCTAAASNSTYTRDCLR